MATIGYTPLERETQDDEVSVAHQSQGYFTSSWKFWQCTSKVIVFGAAVMCVTVICGGVASSVLSQRFAHSNSPGLLPEGFFPDFGKVLIPFVNGGDFTRNDSYGDQVWDQLVPVGAGYLRVPNPRKYDLPLSKPIIDDGVEYAEIFQASVIHQLHCMAILRNYTRAYESHLQPSESTRLHVKHCINYIRYAILCTADTTLEQGSVEGFFTGEGVVHQCRDWSLVKAFLEENRVDDRPPDILHT